MKFNEFIKHLIYYPKDGVENFCKEEEKHNREAMNRLKIGGLYEDFGSSRGYYVVKLTGFLGGCPVVEIVDSPYPEEIGCSCDIPESAVLFYAYNKLMK